MMNLLVLNPAPCSRSAEGAVVVDVSAEQEDDRPWVGFNGFNCYWRYLYRLIDGFGELHVNELCGI